MSYKGGKIGYYGAVFRIRLIFHADPDPGSLKCQYGSGFRPLIFYSDPDPKGLKIKEDNLTNKILTKFFKMTIKHHYNY